MSKENVFVVFGMGVAIFYAVLLGWPIALAIGEVQMPNQRRMRKHCCQICEQVQFFSKKNVHVNFSRTLADDICCFGTLRFSCRPLHFAK